MLYKDPGHRLQRSSNQRGNKEKLHPNTQGQKKGPGYSQKKEITIVKTHHKIIGTGHTSPG